MLSVLNALKIRMTLDSKSLFGVQMFHIIIKIVLLDVPLKMVTSRVLFLKFYFFLRLGENLIREYDYIEC